MKSLRDRSCTGEILERITHVRPDSTRLWGRMTSGQMICHLADGYRLYMGRLTAAPVVTNPLQQKLSKWAALWMPVKWPAGFKTMRELDQRDGAGTRPEEFSRDVQALRGLTGEFAGLPRDFSFPPHPFFGLLSYREWMRLAYLHCDHHLRQFGA